MLDSGIPWSSRTRIAITTCQLGVALVLYNSRTGCCSCTHLEHQLRSEMGKLAYLRVHEEYPDILALIATSDALW